MYTFWEVLQLHIVCIENVNSNSNSANGLCPISIDPPSVSWTQSSMFISSPEHLTAAFK